MPEILSTHTPDLFRTATLRAAHWLRQGQPVGLPTETVYGLAANALDPVAVARIFETKGRPSHNPVIVHVADLPLAQSCCSSWPEAAHRLAAEFWPGPLTLVLPRSGIIPDIVTAGGGTVGLRWPSHPFIQAVIRECAFPLAAPSANPANSISPTTARHVAASLGDRIPLVIDGGPCQVGIESTVVDLSLPTGWRILRPGMIGEDSVRRILGPQELPQPAPASQLPTEAPPEPPRSPGQLPRHYAPRARLLVLAWDSDAHLDAQLREEGLDRASTHILAHHRVPPIHAAGRICVIPDDPEAYARALYAEWHRCDELGARCIVLESLPDLPPWSAIRDRIRRAAAPR